MKKLLYKTYNYILELSNTKYAMAALLFVSFFGSIFFPFPTEMIMMPMLFVKPKKSFSVTTIALISSVLGGIAAYYIGAVFYDSVGIKIIEMLHYQDTFLQFSNLYKKYGYWLVFMGGLTPFPYKVICIASGFVKMNVGIFVLSSFISRAVRYYLIAIILYLYGEKAKIFIEKHLEILSVIVFFSLILVFYLFKFL